MKKIILVAALAAVTFEASAWMQDWAPAFKSTPAALKKLPSSKVHSFLQERDEIGAEYAEGAKLDLNGDKVDDFVYITPWMCTGLDASASSIYFVVSDGKGGFRETKLDGYGAELADLVKVGGKTYFRHSNFFGPFEKSAHNHWVYQMLGFTANGEVKYANKECDKMFPAVTIFYINPKFRQIELTAKDLKTIAAELTIKSKPYIEYPEAQ